MERAEPREHGLPDRLGRWISRGAKAWDPPRAANTRTFPGVALLLGDQSRWCSRGEAPPAHGRTGGKPSRGPLSPAPTVFQWPLQTPPADVTFPQSLGALSSVTCRSCSRDASLPLNQGGLLCLCTAPTLPSLPPKALHNPAPTRIAVQPWWPGSPSWNPLLFPGGSLALVGMEDVLGRPAAHACCHQYLERLGSACA